MEEQKTETAEPQSQQSEQTPEIVKLAFGENKSEPPAEPKDNPGEPQKAPNAAPAPQNEQPPPNNRNDRRFQQLSARLRESEEKSAQLQKLVEELQGKQTPEDAANRTFAERHLELIERDREQLEAAYRELAEERLAEAMPDEKERQEYMEQAAEYAPALLNYAPKAAEYIRGSDIPYKLEKAFYDICSSNAAAFKEFLDFPSAVQKTKLRQLEDYLKQGGTTAPQTPNIDPSKLPKSVIPSESGASAGKPDVWKSTLDRISQSRSGFGG